MESMNKEACDIAIVDAGIVEQTAPMLFLARGLRVASLLLFKWIHDSVRPSIFSARVENQAVSPAQQSIPALTGELQ